jgi:nitric oxide reductase NorD protein
VDSSVLADASVTRLHRMVRDRPVLQAGFHPVWRRLADRGEAAQEEWAAASLALAAVNAGPACLGAFWQATLECDPERLDLLCSSAHAAADICRHAGARAALAALQTLPVAMRLAGGDAGLAGWWHGLNRLAQEAPALVAAAASRVERLLAAGDGLAFADFAAAGLKATAANPARRAAFFALDDPLAQTLLRRQTGTTGFAELERMLSAFATAVWGGHPAIRGAPGSARRTAIASGIVLLPPFYAGAPAASVRRLYRAAVAHAEAHLALPTVCRPVGTLKPLQTALVGLIEDARVEALAIRRFPGLQRLWAGFHVAEPSGARTAATLMARLARALLDPDYQDSDGFVAKGCALFAAETNRLGDPAISRTIGGLLGNELGQMRVQFNARTYVVEPAYRDDGAHLWELPETPDDALAMTIDAARAATGEGGEREQASPAESAPRARDGGMDERGAVLATYPEWDSAAGVERPDWTTLRDTIPSLGATGSADLEAALRARVARLVRGSIVGQTMRQRRQPDGEDLDIDAAIDAAVAIRAGDQPGERIYSHRRPRGRDLATMIVLDVSQSTQEVGAQGYSVLTAERVAVGALAEALEAQGDAYALRAFASAGRDDVRVTRLKDFAEPLSPVVLARLAGLRSGLSTRLGAALRHAGAELAPVRTYRKLLLVLTDGEPSDIDVSDPRELVEDSRRAVLDLRRQGIDVFGIVMDPSGAGSGAAIFGRHNHMPVRRLDELPAQLAGVYFRLAQR